MEGRGVVVTDACVTINLLATRREVEIVRGLGLTLLDTPFISEEVAASARLRTAGLLRTRRLDTDALADAFIDAAARISDGDASCIALAGVLRVPLATDDRRARKVARALYPVFALISTLDLIAEASDALGWDDEELAQVAFDLRWRGRFSPPRSDPRSAWYEALLDR